MEHSTTRTGDRMRQGRPPLVILLLAALLTATVVSARSGSAQVECVIDGDTIRVRMDGARDTVRLTGVDTPETTHPTVGVEPFGPEAFAYTTARLTGATVRLDLDPAGDAIDTAGRWLRYVMLPGGEHVNATLIREGYAMAIRTFLYARRQEFLGLEAQARRVWRGRWAVTDRGGVHAAPWLSGMGAA